MDEMHNANDGTVYPDFIRAFPEADIPIEGIRGWLLEDGRRQVVFFDIMPKAIVPPHPHCAQWGIMLKGEMDLTIKGITTRLRQGDNYFIP
ncbi:MAG: cupin domain-containing protein, partial [candidate division Zixibacteria bacterium]|nr:cupin domain-containing protein [candidate division Zixibacteria bacterium]